MEILWWLAPSAVATLVAIGWVGWAGRQRPERDRRDRRDRTDEADERFASAILKPLPTGADASVGRVRERSTGVAVRREPPGRRSA